MRSEYAGSALWPSWLGPGLGVTDSNDLNIVVTDREAASDGSYTYTWINCTGLPST